MGLRENFIVGASLLGLSVGAVSCETGVERALRDIYKPDISELLQSRDFSKPVAPDFFPNIISRYIIPEDQPKAMAETIALGTILIGAGAYGICRVLSREIESHHS